MHLQILVEFRRCYQRLRIERYLAKLSGVVKAVSEMMTGCLIQQKLPVVKDQRDSLYHIKTYGNLSKQWGSKIRASRDFEWSKEVGLQMVRILNGI